MCGNPYYNPEDFGLEIFAVLDGAMPYEFDMVVLWRHIATGAYYWDADGGCSCPDPFEAADLQLLHPGSFPGLEQAVERVPEVSQIEKREFLDLARRNLTPSRSGRRSRSPG